MSIIKKPSAVDSPYVDTTPAAPTRLASSPVAGGGVNTVASTATPTVSANADANTNASSTGSNVSYYTSGIEGVAGLASYGRVFAGANVYVTLEEQKYITYNQNYTGSGTVGGANGQIQFNNNGLFAGSANLTFDGANLTVGGKITGSQVSTTGSIIGGNLFTAGKVSATGNVSGNYFIGNGSQLTGIATSTGNIRFSGDAIYDLNGIILENADLSHGATAALILPANGNTSPIQINNTYGNILLQTGVTSNVIGQWKFDNTGTLTFPENSGDNWPIQEQRFGMGNIGAWLDGQWTIGEFSGNGVSGQVGIRIDPAIEGNTGITIPSQAGSTTQRVSIYNTGGGGIELYTGANNWEFNADGTTLFPNSTINPGNGISMTVRTPSSGNAYGIAYQTSNSWEAYAEDDATGAHAAYAWIKADLNTVETPRVFITNAKGSDGTELTWTFDADGNLTLPNGAQIAVIGNVTQFNTEANGFLSLNSYDAGGNNIAAVNLSSIDGLVGISTYDPATDSDYHWSFNNNGSTIFPTLDTPYGDQPTGNQTGPTLRIGDGLNDGIISTPDGTIDNSYTNIVLQPGQGYDDSRGGKTIIKGGRGGPTEGSGGGDVRIFGGYGTGGGSGGDIELYPGNSANADNAGSVRIVGTNYSQLWQFNNSGNIIFPTLTVDLHNGGNQSGQTLQFGDPNQQAFITGPAPAANVAAQRLIIQGQRGSGTGEGGDVYVWGGDSDINGGDIKIYAGDADSGASGQGGNIHISGGTGQNTGGEISVTGGTTYNGSGAPVVVTGGRGSTAGGNINLRGGYGDLTGGPISLVAGYGADGAGGNVDITGGQSAGGLSYYGNVNINAGASTWHFDNTGNLTVPGNILGSGNILIAPDSASSSAYLDIYLTGGPDIHIASNDNSIVIGRDTGANIFVGNDGEVSIRTDNGVTAQVWNFDNTGNLTVPGNSTIGTPIATGGAGGNSVTIRAGSSDTFASAPGGDLNLIGGYGSFGDGGGPPGGNVAIASGLSYDSHPGNVTINTGGSNTWTFDYNGMLTVPGEGVINSVNDTVTLRSFNTSTGNANSVYLGTSGGLGFQDTAVVSGNWLEIFRSGIDPQISTPGNLLIRTDSTNTAPTWTFGKNGNLTTPGSGGDISGANLITAVTLSATSNVSAANVNATTLSALGNVIANNAVITNNISGASVDIVNDINSGNLLTSGFVCAVGNVITREAVYAGNGATWQSQVQFGNALVVAADVGEAYTQIAIVNTNGNGSADFAAYADNGNSDQGWVDMGFTGSTFSDPSYTVTGPNDGYVFAQGNASNGGNLVIATGNIGTTKDIVFATGGFQTGNIKARLYNSTGEFSVTGNVHGGNVIASYSAITPPVALANLTAVAGARAFINNANLVAAGNFGAQVGAGGSNIVPVWSNGTNWYIG